MGNTPSSSMGIVTVLPCKSESCHLAIHTLPHMRMSSHQTTLRHNPSSSLPHSGREGDSLSPPPYSPVTNAFGAERITPPNHSGIRHHRDVISPGRVASTASHVHTTLQPFPDWSVGYSSTPQSVQRPNITCSPGLVLNEKDDVEMEPARGLPLILHATLPATVQRNSKENALDLLKKYHTTIIVDDSSSMGGHLWAEAPDALANLAVEAARYDVNGIDVHFLNDKRVGYNMKSAVAVEQLFDSVTPVGLTPTGEKLEELLLDYLCQLECAKAVGNGLAACSVKPINYLVLTDGQPTDDPESVIVAAAKRLDAGNFSLAQVGVQFVQIGSSLVASTALKELDDALAANFGIRDMVDTTPYKGGRLTAETLTKILLGGINRRVDRKGGQSVID